jgi:hypothetical protein
MKTWLFNPFKFIAGNKALLLGISAMIISAILSCIGKVHQDGIIDMHEGRMTASYLYFVEPFIDWVCTFIPLYIFGRFTSDSSVRFIDIAGTAALARYPVIIAVIINMFFVPFINIKELSDIQSISSGTMTELIISGAAVLFIIIWIVALLYNAYSTSANLKGPKAIWTFIASMLIAEVLSKVIIISLI